MFVRITANSQQAALTNTLTAVQTVMHRLKQYSKERRQAGLFEDF